MGFGQSDMKIITYHSTNAPAGAQWLARIQVPVLKKQSDIDKRSKKEGRDPPHTEDKDDEIAGGGKVDSFGYLPVLFRGSTEDEVIARAERGYAERKARLHAGRKNRAEAGRKSAK